MRIRWRGLELPSRVVCARDKLSDIYGEFHVEPFERGFGHTVGNSLRRILLSSLEGSAVTKIKIQGVQHEFSSIPGMVEDITERRQLTQALHDSEERHREILEALPVIVYRADATPPFGTQYISPGIRLLGRSADEWVGAPSAWRDALHADDRDRVIANAELVRRERRPFDCEYRMIAVDGTELWFHDQGDAVSFFNRLDAHAGDTSTFHLNVQAARSAFDVPNTFDQSDAGQAQQSESDACLLPAAHPSGDLSTDQRSDHESGDDGN